MIGSAYKGGVGPDALQTCMNVCKVCAARREGQSGPVYPCPEWTGWEDRCELHHLEPPILWALGPTYEDLNHKVYSEVARLRRSFDILPTHHHDLTRWSWSAYDGPKDKYWMWSPNAILSETCSSQNGAWRWADEDSRVLVCEH